MTDISPMVLPKPHKIHQMFGAFINCMKFLQAPRDQFIKGLQDVVIWEPPLIG